MWSSEIEQLMSNHHNFMGCYALDNLLQTPPPPQPYSRSLIINTSYSNEEGEHWVAVVMKQKACFYFDSFGLPILCSEIYSFLLPYRKVSYSEQCIQNMNSKHCGKYCIAFVKQVNNKQSYREFLSLFDQKDLGNNDIIIENLYKKYIREYNLSISTKTPRTYKMNKAPTTVFLSRAIHKRKTHQTGRGIKKRRYRRKKRSSKSLKKRNRVKRRVRK